MDKSTVLNQLVLCVFQLVYEMSIRTYYIRR